MQHNVIDRARTFVGVPFRPQGRRADVGLDCVGLLLRSHELPDSCCRRNYRLSGDHLHELHEAVQPYFRRVNRTQLRPGDMLVMRVGPEQIHLGLFCGTSFIHAEAGIGRVMETLGKPIWELMRVYRRRSRQRR